MAMEVAMEVAMEGGEGAIVLKGPHPGAGVGQTLPPGHQATGSQSQACPRQHPGRTSKTTSARSETSHSPRSGRLTLEMGVS